MIVIRECVRLVKAHTYITKGRRETGFELDNSSFTPQVAGCPAQKTDSTRGGFGAEERVLTKNVKRDAKLETHHATNCRKNTQPYRPMPSCTLLQRSRLLQPRLAAARCCCVISRSPTVVTYRSDKRARTLRFVYTKNINKPRRNVYVYLMCVCDTQTQ